MSIDAGIYRRIKVLADLRGDSVTAVIEESLRVTLHAAHCRSEVATMPISQRRGGYAPEFVAVGIDPSDTSAVRDYLDGIAT